MITIIVIIFIVIIIITIITIIITILLLLIIIIPTKHIMITIISITDNRRAALPPDRVGHGAGEDPRIACFNYYHSYYHYHIAIAYS